MIRIFELIWHGCWHDWAVTGAGDLFNSDRSQRAVGKVAYYECQKCHRMKKSEVL